MNRTKRIKKALVRLENMNMEMPMVGEAHSKLTIKTSTPAVPE